MATLITKNSSTTTSVPIASQLVQGELAVNVTDKRLFTENSEGSVVELGTNPSSLTLSSGTANGVAYLNGSKVLTTGSALTFDGTSIQVSSNIISGRSGGADGNFVLKRASDGLTVGTLSVNSASSRLELATAYDPITFSNFAGEQMRLTSTGLGIGTSSPGSKLDVLGTGDMSGTFRTTGTSNAASVIMQSGNGTTSGLFAYARFVNNDTSAQDWRIGTYGNNNLSIVNAKAGTVPVVLDYSGNLGLGVTPSAWSGYKALQIGAGTADGAFIAAGNDTNVTTNAYFNAGWKYQSSTNLATMYKQTSGTHQWYNAPSGIAGDPITFTQAMTLDTSGRLGIGLTSPDANLNVNGYSGSGDLRIGAGAAGASTLLFADSATGTGQYAGFLQYLHSSDALVFGVNAAERARIDSAGNLGLGVTPSAWTAFKVIQGPNAEFAIAARYPYIISNLRYDGSWKYSNSEAASYYVQAVGQHQWFRSTSTPIAGNDPVVTQAMTLDASGYLLVGTTSSVGAAANRFQVGGSQTTVQSLLKTTTGHSAEYVTGANVYKSWVAGGFLALGEAPADGSTFTERMRIDSSGNLLVGTTTAIGSGSTIVNLGVARQVLTLKSDTDASYTQGLWNAATTGDNLFTYFGTETSLTVRGSISYNRAGGLVAYNVTSDYRAKDISGPVTNSGALIDSVPVYMGKMKDATQERPMFIAHEVPAYAHTGEKDAVDADGNPVYQQMDASALIPVMWAEIQSLRKRLTALEAK